MSNDLSTQSPDIADTDNDDVVDLLEIVKPGKNALAKNAAPEKEDDFSADLDAMLGQIADAEKALNAAEQSPPTPFPDPTPVDHAVDPDETLNMPSMDDDLNNLLASLGADTASARQVPSPHGTAPSPLPDLDALPLAGQQAVPASQTAPNVPLDLDFDVPSPKSAQPATPPTPADKQQKTPETLRPATPPPAMDEPRKVSDAPKQETPPVPMKGQQKAPEVPQPAEETLPEILLQEGPEIPQEEEGAQNPDLPAMETLFSASIPKPPPALPDMETLFGRDFPDAPAAAPDQPPAGTDAPPDKGDLPVTAQKNPPASTLPPEAGDPQPDDSISSMAPRYDEVDLNELDALLEDMLASAPASGPPPAQEMQENNASARPEDHVPQAAELAPLRQAVNRMETGLADLKGELLERNTLIEKQQSHLVEQAALIEELRVSLTGLRENMDKMAALSAAKVIREELASLLKDDAPAS